MALTLRERVNCLKGLSEDQWSTTPATPMERLEAALQKIAGELIEGSMVAPSLPDYALHHPSDAQTREWCRRVLDNNGMAGRMKPSIVSYNQWDTDGASISDAPIRNTCLYCVCAFAANM